MSKLTQRIANGDESAGSKLVAEVADRARKSQRLEQISIKADGRAMTVLCGPHDLTGADRLNYADPEEDCSRQLWIVRRPDGTELLAAALLIGDDGNAAWYRQLIESATPVNALRDVLMFGQTAAPTQAPANPNAAISVPRAREKLVVIGNGMAGMPRGRGIARDRARRLRHHRLRRRAARQLQPHHAFAGARGREDLRATS